MSRIVTGRRRALAVPAGGTVPLVTDMELITTVASGASRAGIMFNETTVGSVTSLVKRTGISTYFLLGNDDQTVPVDHTGEWTGDIVTAADWEVACVSLVSGTWDFQSAVVGVYSSLATADLSWYETRGGGKGYTPGTNTCTANFRIREVAVPANFTEFEVIATAIQT